MVFYIEEQVQNTTVYFSICTCWRDRPALVPFIKHELHPTKQHSIIQPYIEKEKLFRITEKVD